MFFSRSKSTIPTPEEALAGRPERPFHLSPQHLVLDAPLVTDPQDGGVPEGHEAAIFGLGCFWGAEELYWQMPGVYSTSVGYAGGFTAHPSYEEVCSGRTGHTEAVRVVFDPAVVSYADLVKRFFEVHDPTQGMRQGNDVGTQYRSGIYFANDAQKATAEMAKQAYDEALRSAGHEPITTEIEPAAPFYYAEDYHQQYLHKVPNGYCGLAGTGVSCRIPTAAS
ncbi:MAG TPA: peptide-methionine (S)-S-oxide reductase MsrA [Solirubrobacterales bacterium]|nr:peptide-methionine (S)-S-oxide reductase MsrA [Solirubrobacterales bacterium]